MFAVDREQSFTMERVKNQIQLQGAATTFQIKIVNIFFYKEYIFY